MNAKALLIALTVAASTILSPVDSHADTQEEFCDEAYFMWMEPGLAQYWMTINLGGAPSIDDISRLGQRYFIAARCDL